MDLRGCGESCVPESHDGSGMSKRAMGADALAVMTVLGTANFGCSHTIAAFVPEKNAEACAEAILRFML